MRHVWIIQIILISLAFSATGQKTVNNVKIYLSDAEEEPRDVTLTDVIGKDENGVYVLRTKSQFDHYGFFKFSPERIFNGYMGGFGDVNEIEEFRFQRYTNEMTLDKSFVWVPEVSSNEVLYYEGVVHFADQFFLFTSLADDKRKKRTLYRQTMDKETLQVNQDKKEIATVKYFSEWSTEGFVFDLSPDSTKLMIYYEHPNRGNVAYGMLVYNEDNALVWEKEVSKSYDGDLFHPLQVIVDNEGSVFMMNKLYHDKDVEFRKKEINFEYLILGYQNEGKTENEVAIEMDEIKKYMRYPRMTINDNNELLCGAFTDGGIYFTSIDLSGNGMTKNVEEWIRHKITYDVNIKQVVLRNIVKRTDGGLVIIGEWNYIKGEAEDFTSNPHSYKYYHRDMYVASINPDGSVAWAETVPKYQLTDDDGGFYSSYALAVVKDKLYFVFNDNPNNLDEDKLSKYPRVFGAPGKNTVLALVEINADGEQKRSGLFLTREAEICTRPVVCEQVSGNEMIIFGQRKKTQKVGRLVFE